MMLAFYAADPQELIALFATDINWDEESEETVFAQLSVHPVADFSFYLRIPEDLDSLCQQALHEHTSLIPPIFRDVLVEQVWNNGPGLTESLTTLADPVVRALADLNEQAMENAARKWVATFPCQE
ncbi:MAG TPA: hypothetical protein VFV38_00605 [Ktedonobacteraceae bacterium]|nr:hypothetical protein [Ktedonobacteraceae bacterium]